MYSRLKCSIWRSVSKLFPVPPLLLTVRHHFSWNQTLSDSAPQIPNRSLHPKIRYFVWPWLKKLGKRNFQCVIILSPSFSRTASLIAWSRRPLKIMARLYFSLWSTLSEPVWMSVFFLRVLALPVLERVSRIQSVVQNLLNKSFAYDCHHIFTELGMDGWIDG